MLYLECYSGISGDMMVAALLDLGASREKLLAGLESLDVDGYRIEIGRRVKCGIEACSFEVILDGPEDGGSHDDLEGDPVHSHEEYVPCHTHEDHGHDHEDYGHGHDHGAHAHEDHEHDHGHGTHDHEEHKHGHEHHAHPHTHRNLADITGIIEQSAMTADAKKTALRIFGIVAQAEAKVHGKPIDQVHFHEVGAVDSIVDIAAVSICLDDLGIKEAVISELYEGSGHVHCQHGILPVPVPAVTAIAEAYGLYLRQTGNRGEMVTPTGAAIAAGIRTQEALPEVYRIVKTGMGAGKKDFPRANLLRASLIETRMEAPGREASGNEEKTVEKNETLWTLETNVDDTTGEALGFVMEQLLAAGARDVCYLPAFMKKNRPAYLVKVICTEAKREELEELLFLHTTTIGIRRYPVERTVLPRQILTVETDAGTAQVKIVTRGERSFCYPEYEDVTKYAGKSGISFQEAYARIQRQAEELQAR
ncbi:MULTISPECIES: nickel pincer cofactor biosynthesis protein LarC [unclassified Candidatus Paralachnospira]|uniref:nickel pincer cofactor biosynthesis protein LarC n=1 Tax=unclassified Candidatus Paralachnospira TaxID=3099471 RepID=UPI003F8EE3D7